MLVVSPAVDVNGKPMGFFGPLDFVALKSKESSRMTQHAHGLICLRFFKLSNIVELMERGSKFVMSCMWCVASYKCNGATFSFFIWSQSWSIKSNPKSMEGMNC